MQIQILEYLLIYDNTSSLDNCCIIMNYENGKIVLENKKADHLNLTKQNIIGTRLPLLISL